MWITLIVILTIAAVLYLTIRIVKDGIKDQNYKKVIITILLCMLAIWIGYKGLILVGMSV